MEVITSPLAPFIVMGLAMLTAMLGSVGGLGGAVLLVPALVLLGWQPIDAAPIGLAMVAAGSFAAVPTQIRASLANLRLAMTLESTASIGAATGAVLAYHHDARVMMVVLGTASMIAALAGGTRSGQRNLPQPGADFEAIVNTRGTLASAYRDPQGRVVPYRPRRVALGASLTWVAGGVAGMTGTSGGYLKTPIMSEIMHVPVKVAAATTVFMAGLTASVGLAVYATQGRVTATIAPAVIGGLAGGRLGALLQPNLPAPLVRRLLSVALMVIGLLVVLDV